MREQIFVFLVKPGTKREKEKTLRDYNMRDTYGRRWMNIL